MGRINYTQLLLACGTLSALLYMAMNIIVPMQWPEYDSMSQTVSELSAIGAPTRQLWNWLSLPYALLTVAFSIGILLSGRKNEKLMFTGFLLLFLSGLGFLWPLAPMHSREALAAGASSTSDMMHIGLGALTEILFLVTLFYTAKIFGERFRIFSIMTFLAILFFGFLTILDAPNLQKNLPTPFLGVWERINIAVFLLWTVVLSFALLRQKKLTVANPRM
jgi:hypothetical protein